MRPERERDRDDPRIGSQALAEAFPVCRETFAEADAALGDALSRIIFEGPEEALTLTENTQPALVTVSTAAPSTISMNTTNHLREMDGICAP